MSDVHLICLDVKPLGETGMNLPNWLTVSRFFLAFLFFVLLAFSHPIMRDISLVVFAVAGITDILDGYLARKRRATTAFGRIADPFVDKILICGAFIIFIEQKNPDVGVQAWMVMLIVAREFLVNGLRTFAELHGVPFGATILGKSKMAVQFATVCWILVFLGHFSQSPSAQLLTKVLVWATVVVTVASGAVYIYQALVYGVLKMQKAANA